MQTKRITTIVFNDGKEMVNCVIDIIGRTPKIMVVERKYYDGKDEVDFVVVLQLKKHDINCENRLEWHTELDRWSTVREFKNIFDTEMTVYIQYRWMECITYNLSIEDHKNEVKKVYDKVKELGYDVTHECSSEITSDDC